MSYALRLVVRPALAAFGLVFALAAPAAGQTATVFTSNGFEPGPSGYNTGLLFFQQGFQSVGGITAATVQTAIKSGGAQGVMIDGSSLSNTEPLGFGGFNFWYQSYTFAAGYNPVGQGRPFVQLDFKNYTSGAQATGGDIPLAGAYMEGYTPGGVQQQLSAIMVNAVGGVAVTTTAAIGGSTAAILTDNGLLSRESWHELYTEMNFTTQTFRVYRVGQAEPLAFTTSGGGTPLDSDPGTPGNQPYIDVPFRNTFGTTQRIAEIGLIASYGFDPVGNPFAPLNDFFVDDLLVTATASSQPPPVPEPGFLLAAASLAGLAGWKLRRRRAVKASVGA
jgi:hypothetical protein